MALFVTREALIAHRRQMVVRAWQANHRTWLLMRAERLLAADPQNLLAAGIITGLRGRKQ